MNGLAMIGAIAFDPTIRGILVVVTGTTVLMGSIFMVLATNSGVRVGFLIAITGFFSWMFLMGILWVIYGIGLKGRDPSWMPTDINYSRQTAVPGVPDLAKLPPDDQLPVPETLLDKSPLIHALALGVEGADYEPATLTKLKTVIEPMIVISNADLFPVARNAETEAADLLAQNPDVAELIANGGTKLRDEVRSQAIEMRDGIEAPLGGWCLLTESDPRSGEAKASADAALSANNAFGDNTLPVNYIVKDVFFFGGKEPCEPISEKPSIEQAIHRVQTIFEVKNPELYSAVTVVKAVQYPAVAGEAPPSATIEPGASTVTVGMLRNLGNKRLIPFFFMLTNLMGFIIFATILHYRDKEAMAVRKAFSGSGKGK